MDATEGEGWFYEGTGIYRHVWLTKTAPVRVAQWGTFVESRVQGTAAELSISTEVENDGEQEKLCSVISRVLDPEGKTIGTTQSERQNIPPGGSFTFPSHTSVRDPQLWSLERPNLYRLITEALVENAAIDQTETTFGIRTIRLDPDRGFFLNGKPVKIKGTCNHQDHAGVGPALPDRLQYYRIERLQEMGCNGYRTSHNPPTPELLDACDRLGMLVLDETRMMSSTPEGLSQLDRMMRRDGNHPSIVMWSLGNEEWFVQGDSRGARMVADMKRLARKLDPTRPVTLAMNGGWGKGTSAVVDVQGFNYAGGHNRGADMAKNIDEFHAQFPKQPTVGTETGSDASTRGIYKNDPEKGYVSAYGVSFPGYTVSTENWWKIYDEREFLAGGFDWTGLRLSRRAVALQMAVHQFALWSDGYLRISKGQLFLPSGVVGNKARAASFSALELGREGGAGHRGVVPHESRPCGAAPERCQPRGKKSEPQFARGVDCEVRAGRAGSTRLEKWEVVLTEKRETIGALAKLVLRADRTQIAADGEDVSVLTVEIADAKGLPQNNIYHMNCFVRCWTCERVQH